MSHAVLSFNGERSDSLNDMFFLGNGYRAYRPQLMRFHCPDSWSPFGAGGINSYAYCAGDPVNQSDPSGHHSLGGWLGIGVGVTFGLLLIPVSGGSSLAMVLSGVSVSAALTSAGLAVAQQFMEASAPETASALGWAALGTGIVSGLSAAALSRVVPGAPSLISLLKGTADRPIGGLMMSAEEEATNAPGGGQFRRARFIGIYPLDKQPPGHHLAFHFQDSIPGGTRLNIYGMPAMTNRNRFAIGSGILLPDGYVEELIGFRKLSRMINDAVTTWPDIRTVRLSVPYAGNAFGRRSATFTSRLRTFLRTKYHLNMPITSSVASFQLRGPATDELNNVQNSLFEDHHQLLDIHGFRFTPNRAQRIFDQLSEKYGDVAGAFDIIGGVWR